MKQSYILGVDSGTSFIKAALIALNGEEAFVASNPTPIESPKPTWKEFDMDVDWQTVVLTIRQLLSESKVDKGQVLGVGLTGKGFGLCCLDKDIRPVRKGILWADMRSGEFMQELVETGAMNTIIEYNGGRITAADVGNIAPWLAKYEPETLEKTKYFCIIANYICYKLTGQFGANSSDFYGEIDGRTREYSEEVLKAARIWDYRDKFIPLQKMWEIAGHITGEAAGLTGLPEGIPVICAGMDGVACSLGVGVASSGQANILLGTCGSMSVSSDHFTQGLGAHITAGFPGHWLRFRCPRTGTINTDWYINQFSLAERLEAEKEGRGLYSVLEDETAKVRPGSGGVLYHPYLSYGGEYNPFYDLDARANFFGLNPGTTRGAMLRAVYEGMAYSTKHCMDAMNVSITGVRISGGGAKSDAWCQIFSDICNAPIMRAQGTEFGIKGSAVLVANAIGAYSSIDEASKAMCRPSKVFEPIPENVALYADFFEVYKDLIDAMHPIWAKRKGILDKYGIQA